MAGSDRLDAPWPVDRFQALDSTNLEAMRRLASGEDHAGWIIAGRQTEGRGRLSRNWESPEGNLFASAIIPYAGALRDAPLVCFAAGLAVLDAIEEIVSSASQDVRLKWPNDLVVDERKLGGILVECSTSADRGKVALVVGFGVNLSVAPEVADRRTVSLAELGGGAMISPSAFLTSLDMKMRLRLEVLWRDGFEPIRRDWLERTVHKGRSLTCVLDDQPQVVEFLDIASDGALVVRDRAGATRHVRAGDVGLVG